MYCRLSCLLRSKLKIIHADDVLILKIVIRLLFFVLFTCLVFCVICFMCVRTYLCIYVCMYVCMYDALRYFAQYCLFGTWKIDRCINTSRWRINNNNNNNKAIIILWLYRDSQRVGWSGDRILVGAEFSARVQTGIRPHTAFYTRATGSLLGKKKWCLSSS